MNIALFEASELDGPLPLSDERSQHVLTVLRRAVGESFDAGLVDGPKGKATLLEVGPGGLRLGFVWSSVVEPPLLPIDLIVGLSRPQTCRKILQDATAMGVRSICFIKTDRSEPSYAESKLWRSGEWRRHLLAGAAQAFSTRLPALQVGDSLGDAVERLERGVQRIALDNYEGSQRLRPELAGAEPVALAVGSERGWTDAERRLLREARFALAHLGERPLRSETATVAGIAVLLAGMSRT